jgi:hypothetical protein
MSGIPDLYWSDDLDELVYWVEDEGYYLWGEQVKVQDPGDLIRLVSAGVETGPVTPSRVRLTKHSLQLDDVEFPYHIDDSINTPIVIRAFDPEFHSITVTIMIDATTTQDWLRIDPDMVSKRAVIFE